MMAETYRERVLAALDVMRTAEKDRIILGFITQLYPEGDPDHDIAVEIFVAEAIRLLTPFHPSHLALPNDHDEPGDEAPVPGF